MSCAFIYIQYFGFTKKKKKVSYVFVHSRYISHLLYLLTYNTHTHKPNKLSTDEYFSFMSDNTGSGVSEALKETTAERLEL